MTFFVPHNLSTDLGTLHGLQRVETMYIRTSCAVAHVYETGQEGALFSAEQVLPRRYRCRVGLPSCVVPGVLWTKTVAIRNSSVRRAEGP
jgi:hypothetical protein